MFPFEILKYIVSTSIYSKISNEIIAFVKVNTTRHYEEYMELTTFIFGIVYGVKLDKF